MRLAFLALLWLAPRLVASSGDAPSRATWWGFAAIAAAGLCAVPVMLLPIATASAFVAAEAAARLAPAERDRRVAALVLATVGAGVLAALFYAPALWAHGAEAAASAEAIARAEARYGLREKWARTFAGVCKWWTFGYPSVAVLAVGALAALGALGSPSGRRLLLASVVALAGVGLMVALPPPWSLSYLCVLLLVFASAGASRLTRWVARGSTRVRAGVAGSLLVATCAFGAKVNADHPDRVEAPWFIGYADAREAAAFFGELLQREDPVVGTWEHGLAYYLFLAGVDEPLAPGDLARAAGRDHVYLIERDQPRPMWNESRRLRGVFTEQGFADAEVVQAFAHSRVLRMRRSRAPER